MFRLCITKGRYLGRMGRGFSWPALAPLTVLILPCKLAGSLRRRTTHEEDCVVVCKTLEKLLVSSLSITTLDEVYRTDRSV